MSPKFLNALLATTALTLTLPGTAFAQAAKADPQADNASDSGAIIVTARRESEDIQDVPVSVQAISGNQLQKLSITSVEEVSKLAPGLTLINAGSICDTAASATSSSGSRSSASSPPTA